MADLVTTVFSGTEADNTFNETEHRSIMLGLGGNDNLSGSSYDDVLMGGSDDDRLFGGGGRDNLFGEAGSDTFYFLDGAAFHGTRIVDFSHKERDLISFAGMDADITRAGDQQFDFVRRFHDEAGELRFKNGQLTGDTDGDGKADFKIKLPDVGHLSAGDIIL